MKRIIKNCIRCNHCGDVIESTYTQLLCAFWLLLVGQRQEHLFRIVPAYGNGHTQLQRSSLPFLLP